MLIFDIFRINQLKASLVQTQEARDLLKKELDNCQQIEKDRDALKKLLLQTQEERDLLKKELADCQQIKKERDALKKLLPETDLYCQLRSAISVLEKRKIEITQQISNFEAAFIKKQQELKSLHDSQEQERKKLIFGLDTQILNRKEELIQLDDGILLQSFGFYKPRYDFENSEIYKIKLEQIRNQQEALVKYEQAVYCTTNWTLNNSEKEGKHMIKDYVKLILRSFNNECDASIINVKFNNIESIEKKIRKAFEILNNLGQRMNIVLSADYLNLKLSELYLCHEYKLKKQEEKEEQRRIREQMREDAKVQKEIDELKTKIEKEEKHFNNALQLVNTQLEKASTETEREIFKKELDGIQAKLDDVEKNKQDVQYREQNTRAGYVYIISNIGSFGEDVYKIGVTRRLEPQERVDELGDASVPFYFDIHAMIFSDDAPSLENALHKAFDDRRLNRINLRREFFRVKLEEIETVVKNNFNKSVEFTKLAEAEQYRQSLMLRGKTN
jgi:hypothetical protein